MDNESQIKKEKKEKIERIKSMITIIEYDLIPEITANLIHSGNLRKSNYIRFRTYGQSQINALGKLKKELNNQKSKIESALDDDSKKIKETEIDIQELIKENDVLQYLRNIGISKYLIIEIKKKLDWLAIITVFAIGALEFVGGCFLLFYCGNDFGLINEGKKDIMYGINILLGKEEFSWKEFGSKKLCFLVNVAIDTTFNFILKGFKNPFKKKNPV